MTNKRLILIADDELTNREILAYVLKDSYDLIFAEDGQQALEAAKQYGKG